MMGLTPYLVLSGVLLVLGLAIVISKRNAIAGVPLLSGFYSKDAILASVLGFSWTHRSHWVLS